MIPCSFKGCNRKYKTEAKWLNHLEKAHGIVDPDFIPDKILVTKGVQTKNDSVISERLRNIKTKQNEAVDNLNKLSEMIAMKEMSCYICTAPDAIPDMVAVPCGHGGVCLACSQHLKKCPKCRARVNQYIKIFL